MKYDEKSFVIPMDRRVYVYCVLVDKKELFGVWNEEIVEWIQIVVGLLAVEWRVIRFVILNSLLVVDSFVLNE